MQNTAPVHSFTDAPLISIKEAQTALKTLKTVLQQYAELAGRRFFPRTQSEQRLAYVDGSSIICTTIHQFRCRLRRFVGRTPGPQPTPPSAWLWLRQCCSLVIQAPRSGAAAEMLVITPHRAH
jgi:hypothetical protein